MLDNTDARHWSVSAVTLYPTLIIDKVDSQKLYSFIVGCQILQLSSN